MRIDVSTPSPNKKGKTWIIALLCLLVGGGALGAAYVRHNRAAAFARGGFPGAPGQWRGPGGGPPGGGEGDFTPPTDSERAQMRAEFSKTAKEQLGLSDEQQKKLEGMWSGPPRSPRDFEERRKQMMSVLTPEQQKKWEQARPAMMRAGFERRMERYRNTMSPADFEAFKAKRFQRAQTAMRQRGGFPPFGGGPGGPAAPQTPAAPASGGR